MYRATRVTTTASGGPSPVTPCLMNSTGRRRTAPATACWADGCSGNQRRGCPTRSSSAMSWCCCGVTRRRWGRARAAGDRRPPGRGQHARAGRLLRARGQSPAHRSARYPRVRARSWRGGPLTESGGQRPRGQGGTICGPRVPGVLARRPRCATPRDAAGVAPGRVDTVGVLSVGEALESAGLPGLRVDVGEVFAGA